MQLSTVEIPRTQARERAAEYAREAKRITDPAQRREFEEIARAYRIASRDDVALIALTPTVAAGGTTVRTRVHNRGLTNERRDHWLLPNLAVCKWNAAYCYTRGIQRDGSLQFIDSLNRRADYRSGRVILDAGTFTLPDGFQSTGHIRTWDSSAWKAMVPIVPPQHRPARGLGDRLVLFEAEDWEWTEIPRPPGDPALLRHVGGDIYAVEAVWDLTPLEKLVLSGRRP